eukprot:6111691-Alexandrium_andersonii.AAC.1
MVMPRVPADITDSAAQNYPRPPLVQPCASAPDDALLFAAFLGSMDFPMVFATGLTCLNQSRIVD